MASHNRDAMSTAMLQDAQGRLASAQHILDAFAHRHKNQHRGSQWWAQFDMLRRGHRKLLLDLDRAVQRAVLMTSRPARRPKTQRVSLIERPTPELGRVAQRATWLHEIAVVRAYEAFTQLAADNQFAHLGLALIGVLAQIEVAIAPFVSPQVPETPTPARIPAASRLPGATGAKPATHVEAMAPAVSAALLDDLGVAVSRDETDDSHVDTGARSPPRPKSSRRKADAFSTDIPLSSPPALKEARRDKKRKKGKPRGGDEFDVLFSSLI